MDGTDTILMRAKPLAERILAECRAQVQELLRVTGRRAGLAVVLVGGSALDRHYFERKRQACADLGLHAVMVHLPAETTTQELCDRLAELGWNDAVHAILLQYPLPPHIDERRAADAIPAAKDVDVTAQQHPPLAPPEEGNRNRLPCAVEGARLLLHEYGVIVAGRAALVIGSESTLTTTLAAMLQGEGASVASCDPDAADLQERLAAADVVATAIGRPNFLRGDWLKTGAVVIDTGLNAVADGVVGDVDAVTARGRAGWLTPVPGGIGTMTLAVLVARTLVAAEAATQTHGS